MTTANNSPLGRAWAAWSRFWFTPADPTPLCLMRIVAGLLVLYVHVAYCFDLQAMFGPHGWYSREQADRERHEWPVLVPQGTWVTQPRFRMPQIAEHRRALREFLGNVARDKEAMPKVLRLLRGLPADREQRMITLRYLQNRMPESFEQRDELFRRMVDAPADDADAQKSLPPFLLSLTRAQREMFRADAHALYQVLPAERQLATHVFTLLQIDSGQDLGPLALFIERLAANNPTDEAREQYLDYCEYWGFAPDDPDLYVRGHIVYSPFFHTTDPRAVAVLHGLHLLVIVLFTVGFCTRVTSVLTWLAALAYIQRNPVVLFGQDTMMNLCLFYLMLAPCGATWSVDWLIARYRAGRDALRNGRPPADDGPRPLVSAGFIIRMLQIHYCLMYLSAGLSKLKGETWWSGVAPFLCMTNPEFSPLHLAWYRDLLHWLCLDQNRVLWELWMNTTNVFTLVLEIGFPFLVWTRLRPVMVGGAVLLHTGIALNMGLVVFSLFMFTLLLCWMTPAAVRGVFARPPARLQRLQLRYSSRDERQVRTAAAAHALDVWGQIDIVDRAAAGREPDDEPAELIAGGEAATGFALAQRLARALGVPGAWVLRLPGVAQVGRAVYDGGVRPAPTAERDEAAKKRAPKPVATR